MMRLLAAVESRARPDIVVRIRPEVIQVQRRETGIGRVVPVAAADRKAHNQPHPL